MPFSCAFRFNFPFKQLPVRDGYCKIHGLECHSVIFSCYSSSIMSQTFTRKRQRRKKKKESLKSWFLCSLDNYRKNGDWWRELKSHNKHYIYNKNYIYNNTTSTTNNVIGLPPILPQHVQLPLAEDSEPSWDYASLCGPLCKKTNKQKKQSH